MKMIKRLIIVNCFQIGVNIIGLPEYHYITKTGTTCVKTPELPKSKYHA